MNQPERALVLDPLNASYSRLVVLTLGLTPEQWHFRESSDRWSIAENIEHLVLFERFILSAVAACLERPAEPEKKGLVSSKQELVLGLASSRHIPFVSRAANLPTGRWPDSVELLVQFRLARESTLAFLAATKADLHAHFFAHIAWGDLDCYQWLLLLSQHSLRHACQIEQVMSDPAYPAF